MKRLPNPWIWIPVVMAAAAGGVVGYLVTNTSCAPSSCVTAAVAIAVASGVGVGVGVGVVVVLAVRSIGEHRELQATSATRRPAQDADPGPPTC